MIRISQLSAGSPDCRSETRLCAAIRGHLERAWRRTHTLVDIPSPISDHGALPGSLLSVTEAEEMTVKKSKTVAFESRAGDLTALYCMSDWMIAVVLAIIAIMSVWAALIIYRSIQTLKGPRRKVKDNTILETEKDGKETTNEEAPLSYVASTETELVPEALESWDGEGWKREPMVRIPTIDEDVEPIEAIPTTNEDLQTTRLRRTTKKSDGPYAEFHLCSPPEEHGGGLCRHYEGLCQVCGGLCQDDAQSRTDHTLDKEEPATTSHRSLSDINLQSGQMKATDVYNPEEGLKEVELRKECHRECTEESVASHPLTLANEPPESPEVNETLPDMLTDSDLQEPDHVCYTEMQEVQYPDDMTRHVAMEILSYTDPTEPLPRHPCGMDIEEVEYPEDVNSLVTITPQEGLDMILTDSNVIKSLADCVRDEAVGCPDDGDIHVAFANTQESQETLTLCDTDLQEPDQLSVTEIQELKCPGADMTSHVEVVYEKTRTMEDDMEALVEDLYSHFPLVDDDLSAGFEYCDVANAWLEKRDDLDDCGNGRQQAQSWNTTGIDTTERMTSNPQELFEKQPDSLGRDPNGHCVLHDNAMGGLSREPTEARDTHVVSEQKGEGANKSMDTRVESSCQEVEINIMEATMDCNEWMTVSGTDAEGNVHAPWVRISHSSVDCSAEAEHHPTETPHNADGSTTADAPASMVKETETTPVSLDGDLQENKMAAVIPIEPHAVQVRFCIHYHTLSVWQELAVTGNQPELGSWKGFVPLERGQDGFWASWVALPAERLVEWKFVLVENGEIQRWEESENRHLETGHGGGVVNLNRWWGFL
uniref:CBM20 domain-containing protein n=1 Tax=Hucho hucho TaxID=62062 RepID=A0A4W5R7S3_9TELE